MEENSGLGWIILIVMVVVFLIAGSSAKYDGMTAEEWFNEYDSTETELQECQDNLSDYEDALDTANSNIEDAKYYAWESYYDMGYALEDLETVSY